MKIIEYSTYEPTGESLLSIPAKGISDDGLESILEGCNTLNLRRITYKYKEDALLIAGDFDKNETYNLFCLAALEYLHTQKGIENYLAIEGRKIVEKKRERKIEIEREIWCRDLEEDFSEIAQSAGLITIKIQENITIYGLEELELCKPVQYTVFQKSLHEIWRNVLNLKEYEESSF